MVELDFGGITLDFNKSGEIQIKVIEAKSYCQQLWCAMILTTDNSNMSDNFTVSVVRVYFVERLS